ncbi:L-lactate dehydrogenase [Streptococcus dentiloxodontae]
MSRKIGIIGMGNVGAALAHAYISEGLADSYVFIDINDKKAEADAQDFKDAMANLPNYAKITVNDYQALEDADIIVSSLGNIQLQHNAGEDRFAEFPFTKEAVYQVSQKLKPLDFKGVLLVISNPVDAVAALYQHFTGWPKERVIGTGTLLDTARMKAAVADDLSVNPRSVSGYNLGEHGNSQFTAWSQVTVKGRPITDLTTEKERQELFIKSMKGGHTVFYGKGFTSYGIASAALHVSKAVLSDSFEILPVSTYQKNLGTYLGYPVVLGRNGVTETIQLSLTPEENALLEKSAKLIKVRVDEAIKELEHKKYFNTTD